MEKLGSWKGRRKCEVGVNYGEMGELKKKIKFYFNVKTNRYEGSYIFFGLSNINSIAKNSSWKLNIYKKLIQYKVQA